MRPTAGAAPLEAAQLPYGRFSGYSSSSPKHRGIPTQLSPELERWRREQQARRLVKLERGCVCECTWTTSQEDGKEGALVTRCEYSAFPK